MMKKTIIFWFAFLVVSANAHDGIKRQPRGDVDRIVAGPGISVSPGSGRGDVTVTAIVISSDTFIDTSGSTQTKSGGIIAASFSGSSATVTSTATLTYANVGSITSTGTTLNILSSVNSNGDITATSFIGNGSALTNLPAGGQSLYRVTIGTLGATGVDIASNTVDGYIDALVRLNANGLTNSTTGGGLIYIKEGAYGINNTTIPAGVTIVAVGSTVWVNAGANGAASAFIFGVVDGLKFDLNNRAFSVEQVAMRNNGILRNSKIYGARNQGTGAGNLHSCAWGATDAFNVLVENNVFEDFRSADGVTRFGDVAPFLVRNSSYVIFRDNQIIISNTSKDGGSHFGIIRSTNVIIQRNNWPSPGFTENGFSVLDHTIGFQFLDNTVHINKLASNGVILLGDNSSPSVEVASITVIANNVFTSTGQLGTSNIVFSRSNTGAREGFGIVVTNNIVNVGTGSDITFYRGDARTSALVTNNHLYNVTTFTAGTGSIVQSGNYLNRVAQ